MDIIPFTNEENALHKRLCYLTKWILKTVKPDLEPTSFHSATLSIQTKGTELASELKLDLQ